MAALSVLPCLKCRLCLDNEIKENAQSEFQSWNKCWLGRLYCYYAWWHVVCVCGAHVCMCWMKLYIHSKGMIGKLPMSTHSMSSTVASALGWAAPLAARSAYHQLPGSRRWHPMKPHLSYHSSYSTLCWIGAGFKRTLVSIYMHFQFFPADKVRSWSFCSLISIGFTCLPFFPFSLFLSVWQVHSVPCSSNCTQH